MLRAGRRLEAVMRGLAGPSRLYATVPTTITGQSRGPPLGTQMTVMGTPSPIPVLKGTGERPAYEEREVGENGEDVELEEPVFQPPPMLDTPTRGYLEPQPLPRTHGIPVAILHLRSFHIKLLDLFIHFALHCGISLGIPTTKAEPLPTQRRLWTVIKGTFVHNSRHTQARHQALRQQLAGGRDVLWLPAGARSCGSGHAHRPLGPHNPWLWRREHACCALSRGNGPGTAPAVA